jgi:hypothetical protein
MNTALERPAIDSAIVERVLLDGDLRQLTPAQKLSYYQAVCESVGLNPLTQPFAYITLNGKEALYAKREATEQLRSIHRVSINPSGFTREVIEGVYVVTAPASLPDGRTDVSTGAVWIEGLKGEARANAMLKAETKAKRRVTLSICGLGMLDETEVETIPGATSGYVVEAPALSAPLPVPQEGRESPSAGNGGDSRHSALPKGTVLVQRVERDRRGAKALLHLSDGRALVLYKAALVQIAEQRCQDGLPVVLELKTSQSGNEYIVGITDPQTGEVHDEREPTRPPLEADDIPFGWLLVFATAGSLLV